MVDFPDAANGKSLQSLRLQTPASECVDSERKGPNGAARILSIPLPYWALLGLQSLVAGRQETVGDYDLETFQGSNTGLSVSHEAYAMVYFLLVVVCYYAHRVLWAESKPWPNFP